MNPRQLDEQQAWLQAAILRQPWAASPATTEGDLAGALSASSRQSPAERLAVYQRAYAARLLDVLRHEYPVVLHLLGRSAFDALAAVYLAEHPSRSHTLTELGAAFPRFLEEAPRTTGGRAAPGDDWATLWADVARWERTTCEIYSGPGWEAEPPWDAGNLAGLPLDDWLAARFQPAPSLRLLQFRHAVVDFCLSVRRGGQPPRPAGGVEYAAASRVAYRVRWRTLPPAEFQLLQDLCAGATVGDALAAHCARHAVGETAQAAATLRDWFASWAQAGYFRAVR